MEFLHRRASSPHPRDFPDLYRKHLESSSKVLKRDSSTQGKVSKIFGDNVPSSPAITPNKPVEVTPLKLPSIAAGNEKRDTQSLVTSLRKKIQDTRES